MVLLDTSGLLANYDRRDRHHASVVQVMRQPQRRVLSPFVLAELDHLLADASIAALAERYTCRDLLTLDQRHVRAVPGPQGQPFRLLPLDA